MTFAQPSDIMARYDVRRLGDLVSDSGARVASSALLTDPNLAVALQDASGMIAAAIYRGMKYTADDLASMIAGAADQTSPLFASYNLLVRLTCDLAYGLLVSRRGFNNTDTASQAPRYVEALRQLQLIEDGEWVFMTGSNNNDYYGAGTPRANVGGNDPAISGTVRFFGDLSLPTAGSLRFNNPFNRD